MRSNKKLIVIISIILTLAVASVAFGYLFFMTDIFKSKEELFAQYFAQHIEIFEKITDFKSVEIYNNLKNETKYESNTNIKMVHSEGGEISNPLNNLSLKLEIQKNFNEQYFYADGKILFNNETYLEAEAIKEKELYGVRIPEAVKEFVSVENDENLQNISDDIGVDVTYLQDAINILDEKIDDTKINSIKDKYSNMIEIISDGVAKGTFEKQNKVVINVDGVSVQANEYSVLLKSEQVRNILNNILDNFENEIDNLYKIIFGDGINDEKIDLQDESIEIPEIKITTYEQNKKTIRSIIEINKNKIIIECSEQNSKVIASIDYIDNEKQIEINITKNNEGEQEKIDIIANVVKGEEQYAINLLSKMQNINNQIVFNAEISHKKDIIKKSIILENIVNIGNSFEKKQSLKETGNVTLNNLQQQRRKDISEILKTAVPQTIYERIILLGEKFGIKSEQNNPVEKTDEEEITQVEINKFNSKFEFYTGDEVSYENVETLLDVVKNNIAGHMIGTVDLETESEADAKKIITLYIEKDKMNEESITKVSEILANNKKYKVSISYKDTNGLIDYITITEI